MSQNAESICKIIEILAVSAESTLIQMGEDAPDAAYDFATAVRDAATEANEICRSGSAHDTLTRPSQEDQLATLLRIAEEWLKSLKTLAD